MDSPSIAVENGDSTLESHIAWTVANMQAILNTMAYTGENRPKDAEVEAARLPSMTRAFWSLVAIGVFPLEEAFVDTYLAMFFDPVDGGYVVRGKKTPKVYSEEGLKGRILRAYPSLLRDLHFYLLLLESGQFERVAYSLEQDKNGIDITVERQGVSYYLPLFIRSPRSDYYRDKKKYGSRHAWEEPILVNEIPVVMDFEKAIWVGSGDDASRKGRIALYDESRVAEVLSEIQKKRAAA